MGLIIPFDLSEEVLPTDPPKFWMDLGPWLEEFGIVAAEPITTKDGVWYGGEGGPHNLRASVFVGAQIEAPVRCFGNYVYLSHEEWAPIRNTSLEHSDEWTGVVPLGTGATLRNPGRGGPPLQSVRQAPATVDGMLDDVVEEFGKPKPPQAPPARAQYLPSGGADIDPAMFGAGRSKPSPQTGRTTPGPLDDAIANFGTRPTPQPKGKSPPSALDPLIDAFGTRNG